MRQTMGTTRVKSGTRGRCGVKKTRTADVTGIGTGSGSETMVGNGIGIGRETGRGTVIGTGSVVEFVIVDVTESCLTRALEMKKTEKGGA